MKKMTIIILVIIIVFFIYFYFKKESIEKKFKRNLKFIDSNFGSEIAKNIERMYRLETNHFKSGQFKHTFSPGMESFGKSYPYGWNTMARIFWDANPQHRPVGFYKGKETQTGITKIFLKFPTLKSAMLTVAMFLRNYSNNPGRWFSTDLKKQTAYNDSIYKFKTPYYNEIIV